MKNKYQALSKISPQKEKGRRQIANDVYNALIRAKLSGAEYQTILFVISKTWGFGEKSAIITLREFGAITGLSRAGLIKAIKKLEARRYLIVRRIVVNQSLPVNTFMFNKFYDTWLKETGIPQFTTMEVKYMLKVIHTGIPQLTSLSPQTSKPQLTPTGIPQEHKLVNQSRPYNSTKEKEKVITPPAQQKKTVSVFAEKTKKDMKNKKPLKMGTLKKGIPDI